MTDVDQLVALDSDAEVMRYLTGGKPSTRSEVEGLVAKALGSRWMAYERGTGAFVGWLAGRATGEDEYELGYRLVRNHWGRGLATEGTLAVMHEVFSVREAKRVWAQTMAVNTRSRRVMERCGLKYVRTFHLRWDDPIEGTEQGEVEYELWRRDWEAGVKASKRTVTGEELVPFRIEVPDDELTDLRNRLDKARWAPEPPRG